LKRSNTWELLGNLDEQFAANLSRNSESQRRDGVDIGLVRVPETGDEVLFTGALGDLYLSNGSEFIRMKGNRYPAGGGDFYQKKRFLNQQVFISGKCQFFLFSDGFQDQFGGVNGKKLGRKRWGKIPTDIV
jgi:sigma-B regulation protein RsbU (phosphoserine phosphatase)